MIFTLLQSVGWSPHSPTAVWLMDDNLELSQVVRKELLNSLAEVVIESQVQVALYYLLVGKGAVVLVLAFLFSDNAD